MCNLVFNSALNNQQILGVSAKYPAYKRINKTVFEHQRRRVILDREKRMDHLVEVKIKRAVAQTTLFENSSRAQLQIERAERARAELIELKLRKLKNS